MVAAAAHKGPNASCCSLARVAQIRVVSRLFGTWLKQSHHLHLLFAADPKSVLVGVRLRKVLPYCHPCPGSCHSFFHGTARITNWKTFWLKKSKIHKPEAHRPRLGFQRAGSSECRLVSFHCFQLRLCTIRPYFDGWATA